MTSDRDLIKTSIDSLPDSKFDAWEYPQKCCGCGRYDNHNPKEPVAVLDANTKLCEFCFEEKYDGEE